ncbi:4'-phosphopantetheinyl transferase superfamily protein [Streptomyces sp. RKAG290]|uniref:4'-phosphopantetheinyl transferase family protein n=1 Tax=Streptomyces sp. RKAG290 TaxID=2888348 RepID=UPI0020340498|nr:4'-phosphopantetheinyl transferase superfamily protein [Streptomyces sp. RKAG290]MCM2413084.1 4'-phosphopantetheinyl transferase superfamily protein [Streptomyces sp. RKAG290]
MLERILPSCAAVVESRVDPPEAELYPQEAALVTRAVASRRREFTTVRHCARLAMSELGLPPGPVLPGRHGAPQWPGRTVGSLTHCAGFRGAALARDTDITMLGIDAEPHSPLRAGLLDAIALPREKLRLADHRVRHPEVCWDRLLFSAKESVYKAWNPRTGQRLGFEDADIVFAPDTMTFTARLLVPRPAAPAGTPPLPDRLDGRWLVGGGLVLTAIAVPAATV